MTRFTKGLPISGSKLPVYDEDDETPDFRTLDLSEAHELLESMHEKIRADTEAAKIKQDADAKERTERQEQYKKWLESQNKTAEEAVKQ